ncbi:MAG: DnaD domain protein [Lachnospiraceae bacterium]|nr:DnaD domain protein [Lachnospiraceae bacterium]
MAAFSVYQDSYIGATIISNRFIDEYMTEANDAQLKVYLYLVRMLNANLETSISDIADRFNHTEKDVVRSFKYWEKRGVLTIDYDEEGNLTGVHLTNLCKGDVNGPTVEATHKKVPLKEAAGKSVEEPGESKAKAEAGREYEPEQGRSAVTNIIPAKLSYSAGDLNEFGNNGGKQLIFLAETYFAKTVSPTDIQTLIYINEELGFSEDLIDYLLQYCAEKGKRDFRYAEKVAIAWREKGVTTVEEARNSSLKYDKGVYDIMNRLGKSGSPTDKEMEFIIRWRDEYLFSDDIIALACDKTVLATDSHRFQYAEGILSSWFGQGVKSVKDIEKLEKEHKENLAGSASSALSGRGNGNGTAQLSGQSSAQGTGKRSGAGSFGNFRQNDTDLEELSKKLYAN